MDAKQQTHLAGFEARAAAKNEDEPIAAKNAHSYRTTQTRTQNNVIPATSSGVFHPFPRLPVELQILIFELHASSAISGSSILDSKLSKEHDCPVYGMRKTGIALYLTFEYEFPCCAFCGTTPHLPIGLRVSHLAREVTLNMLYKELREQTMDYEVLAEFWRKAGHREVKLLDFRGRTDTAWN